MNCTKEGETIEITENNDIRHEYLRSHASRCLSLSSSFSGNLLAIYRDTRTYILDLASKNFALEEKKTKVIDFMDNSQNRKKINNIMKNNYFKKEKNQ